MQKMWKISYNVKNFLQISLCVSVQEFVSFVHRPLASCRDFIEARTTMPLSGHRNKQYRETKTEYIINS